MGRLHIIASLGSPSILNRYTHLHQPIPVVLQNGVVGTHQTSGDHQLRHDVLGIALDTAAENFQNGVKRGRGGHEQAGSVVGGDAGQADHLVHAVEGQLRRGD